MNKIRRAIYIGPSVGAFKPGLNYGMTGEFENNVFRPDDPDLNELVVDMAKIHEIIYFPS